MGYPEFPNIPLKAEPGRRDSDAVFVIRVLKTLAVVSLLASFGLCLWSTDCNYRASQAERQEVLQRILAFTDTHPVTVVDVSLHSLSTGHLIYLGTVENQRGETKVIHVRHNTEIGDRYYLEAVSELYDTGRRWEIGLGRWVKP